MADTTTIGVMHKNPKFFAAVKTVLSIYMDNVKFAHLTSQGELNKSEEIDTIATVGMPSFPPDHKRITVISLSAEYSSDPPTKKARWDMLNNEQATPSEIAKILSKPKIFDIVPEQVGTQAASEINEQYREIAEAVADGDSVKHIEALTKQRDLALAVASIA